MPFTLFDGKQSINDQQQIRFVTKSLGNATITYHHERASSVLAVTSISGSRAIRQSRERINYQPGKSLAHVSTFVMGTGSAGVAKRMGYFDDENGCIFRSHWLFHKFCFAQLGK